MAELPDDLLERPVEEAARRMALSFLDEARDAAPRVGTDPEGLHDVRVGLRRLRSLLRAYEPHVELPRKLLRRLKKLAAATGGGRDAEVLLGWVEEHRARVTARQRPGVAWLAARLAARKEAGYAEVAQGVLPELIALDADLRPYFTEYRVTMRLDEPRAVRLLAPVLGALVTEHVDDLSAQLARVQGSTDVELAHEARIRAKRLRYLLDPVRDRLDGAADALKQLKKLQELLGALHDRHVLSEEIALGLAESAATRSRELHDIAVAGDPSGTRMRAAMAKDERAGLLALSKMLGEEVDEIFGQVRAGWLGAREAPFFARARALGATLTARANEGREIERKYLLHSAPSLPRATVREIDQGYVPGKQLRERLRKVVENGETKYFRTMKLGKGVSRIEVEEETDEALFKKLWALTRGARVRKRRHAVLTAGRVWEIDEFLDRPLWLAEIELESEDEPVTIPDWLAPHVVREVTLEDAYVNVNLAK